MTDKLKLQGIFSQGYGIIPKAVMRDNELSIEAKSIYSYISSYAGAGNTAFPSVQLICSDLNISEKRFQRHKKQLEDKGYITTSRERKENGFSNNIYTINHSVPVQNVPVQNIPVGNVPVGNVREQNDTTNNNNINNNIFNNNNINNDDDNREDLELKKHENLKSKQQDSKVVHQFYQENINAMETPHIAQEIEFWVKDLSVELVLEALKRTVEYGGEFGYTKRILRNWEKKGINTLEEVEQADAAFEQKNTRKYNNRNNKQKPDEKLPDWAKSDDKESKAVNDEPVSEDDKNDHLERIARLRRLREEKLNG